MGEGTRVFVTDFGLAKDTATGSRYTRTGTTLGTPAYMSPELARGEFAALTTASDVWALGVVLFELLVGRLPFQGENTAALIGNLLTAPVPPLPAGLAPDQRGLSAIVRCALSKAATQRYPAADGLRDDLQRLLASERVRAPAGAGSARWIAAGATIAAVLVGVTWVAVWASTQRETARTSAPAPAPAPALDPNAELFAEVARLRATDPAAAARRIHPLAAAHPEDRALQIRLAELWRDAGDWERARAVYTACLGRDPGDVEARFGRGFVAYLAHEHALGREANALDDLGASVALPGWRGALARAVLQFREERTEVPSELLAPHVDRWEPRLVRALMLHHRRGSTLDDQRQAIQELTAVMASVPPTSWLLAERGHAYSMLADWPHAAADFAQATRLAPSDPVAWESRASCWVAAGEPEKLLEVVEEGLQHLPANSHLLCSRAEAFLMLQRLAEAERDFDAAIQANPRVQAAWFGRGNLRMRQQRWDDAIADFTRALALDADFSRALVNRASAWLEVRRPDQAIADCSRAIALGSVDGFAVLTRGRAYEMAGDRERALADYATAITLMPDDPSAWYNHGCALLGFKRYAEAAAQFTEAIARDPDHVKAWINRASARVRSGDPDGALADAQHAVALDPDRPQARFWLGRVHHYRGEWSEARKAYEEFLRRWPDHAWAPNARRGRAEVAAQGGD